MAKSLKELNTRVEQLATQFELGLNEFKKSLKPNISNNSGMDIPHGELINKFQNFEEIITSSLETIKNDLKVLEMEVTENSKNVNLLTLHKNKKMLIIHGVEETNSDLYEHVTKLFMSKFDIEVRKSDLNECYRLGHKKIGNKKGRPIVVDFIHCWNRDQLFAVKKKLKGSNIFITEVLTPKIATLFKNIRAVMGIATWTRAGNIVVMVNQKKHIIKSQEEWLELKSNIDSS